MVGVGRAGVTLFTFCVNGSLFQGGTLFFDARAIQVSLLSGTTGSFLLVLCTCLVRFQDTHACSTPCSHSWCDPPHLLASNGLQFPLSATCGRLAKGLFASATWKFNCALRPLGNDTLGVLCAWVLNRVTYWIHRGSMIWPWEVAPRRPP